MKTEKSDNTNFEVAEASFEIEGTQPLIVHKFSEKAQTQIKDK